MRMVVALCWLSIACACGANGLGADGGGAPDAGVHLDAGDTDAGLTPARDGGEPADGGAEMPWPCPADMSLVSWFCMDRYEAPNIPGALPWAMQTAPDGAAWCGERGKRLCTEDEWIRACSGPEGSAYPYGDTWVASRCNDDKIWISPDWALLGTWPADGAKQEAARLYQGDPSGSRAQCRSSEGVFDLTGNVAEWVVRTRPNANNYDHVMKGCYWAKCFGGSNPSCGFVNPAHPGEFRTYEAGFRCCKDADIPSPIGN